MKIITVKHEVSPGYGKCEFGGDFWGKEVCMELRQMLMQKTAGQRKDRPKDLSWENLERVKVTIICEAMALVFSGEYEEKDSGQ